MRSRLFPLLLVASLAMPVAVHADPLPAPAKAEVTALLARLEASGCEFSRNGSWHSGAEARTHLARKLEYLENKNLVKTAEQFIERGASQSSMSGKPYLVRCGGAAPVESKTWLTRELAALRGGGKPASAPASKPAFSR
ncbi:DUF5329 domain-containing protein [Mitsuaria sp. GD03876]|uniref:DUF5329 domain-containing protein n=1 Tax=Mitsuaria sp. GD03876 TaxID=2975399 RepID=UPI00244BFB85|nr:DUF5329 domain-containing protein [Mitsuaria sp. GD03876]MDH0867933.1 DUF5329 domain-containing protein [Mitsuaria sp. GD03876]